MDKELGVEKSKAWRESGKLDTRPDPITGSDQDPLKEYKVPREVTQYAKGDSTNVKITAASDADAKDLEDLRSITDTTKPAEVE
eukprot:3779195-Pyramimonas_sp.AAC.1